MYGFFDLKDKIKRYFRFSKKEIISLIITILILAFIISFNKWGDAEFDLTSGLTNLFTAIILMALIVIIQQAGHRIIALHAGFRVEYNIWWYGLVIGLILAFISRGHIWFLAPGGIMIHHMAAHRLGYFRYGTNTLSMSMAALGGPLFNIITATIIKTMDIWFGLGITTIPFFDMFVRLSWWYAIYCLLPIPPLPGFMIFFNSRLTYSFIFGSIAGYGILVLLNIYSFIFALLIGGLIWLIYYIFFEKGAWKI